MRRAPLKPHEQLAPTPPLRSPAASATRREAGSDTLGGAGASRSISTVTPPTEDRSARDRIAATTSSKDVGEVARTSATRLARAGTTLGRSPARNTPTLTVTSGHRPLSAARSTVSPAAAIAALTPCSGSMPAWVDRPLTSSTTSTMPLRPTTTRPSCHLHSRRRATTHGAPSDRGRGPPDGGGPSRRS